VRALDGVVGNWLVTDRANVAANQALMMVVDLTELEVEAAVAEVYAETLAPGQSAEITVGSERLRGEVRLVSPEVQNAQVLTRSAAHRRTVSVAIDRGKGKALTWPPCVCYLELEITAHAGAGGGQAGLQ
jgi:multidrug resistance efflux pump